MTRILVLYHSTYGHVEAMAAAIAEGVREAGAEAVVMRVPETVPQAVAESSGYKLDQSAQVADINQLGDYDGLVIGCGTRFGRMPSQMASFLDRAGGLWLSGKLVGKVGAAFSSTSTQHGGNETTLFSIIANLLHFGMVIVGLPYSFEGQSTVDEVAGGSPYGASTITGSDGARMPSALELAGARFQGRLVAEAADRLAR